MVNQMTGFCEESKEEESQLNFQKDNFVLPQRNTRVRQDFLGNVGLRKQLEISTDKEVSEYREEPMSIEVGPEPSYSKLHSQRPFIQVH
mmetsp:Transcript_1256/g.1294  ORF Transcript_1256/g.1294 Transcript_1256/m.1294 type:complete len:89 (-) Transcript_1256:1483-1749(-)